MNSAKLTTDTNVNVQFRVLLIVASLVICFAILIWVTQSFASTCSTTVSYKWPCGSTVGYSLTGFNAQQSQKHPSRNCTLERSITFQQGYSRASQCHLSD